MEQSMQEILQLIIVLKYVLYIIIWWIYYNLNIFNVLYFLLFLLGNVPEEAVFKITGQLQAGVFD